MESPISRMRQCPRGEADTCSPAVRALVVVTGVELDDALGAVVLVRGVLVVGVVALSS
jgi:hypothetical protein